MANRLKKYFSQITSSVSKDLELPNVLALTVRVLSNLQIASIILSASTFSLREEKSSLLRSFGSFLMHVRSIIMFEEGNTDRIAIIIANVCLLYIISQFVVISYIIFKLYQGNKPNPWASKFLAFVGYIHRNVLFFPLHCFFSRFIYTEFNCNNQISKLFYCRTTWLIVLCIYGIINLILAFVRELFTNQIRNQKDGAAIKDNLYPLLILTQKVVIVPLIYFVDQSHASVIVLNIMTCLLSLYILQKRLPFYHLKILRLEIAFSTVNLLFSLFMTTQAFEYKGNILIMMILTAPVVIKLSLLYHNHILHSILNANKLTDPYKAIHLPILVSEYIKQINRSPEQNRPDKPTLYISGFLNKSLEHRSNSEALKEAKIQAYELCIEKLQTLLQTDPNNQLLILSVVRLYMKLNDIPKAMSVLNRIPFDNISFSMRIAVEDLFCQLEEIQCRTKRELSKKLEFLDYFEHRNQTARLKSLIQQELILQIKLWRLLNENSVDADKVIVQTQSIDVIQKRINDFWSKELKDLEKIYVSAPLLYGLYLQIVQSLPYLGSPLIQKTYKLILNKGTVHKDITDIILGNSTCIIFSSEPDRAGRVIDASASVKQVFEISRQNLIGSSINIILPKSIAHKHDDWIRNLQTKFSQGVRTNFTSYARTFSDKYIPVDITLHPLPSLKQGLNMVSYIRKLSGPLSMMIVDHCGRVLECSKDLQGWLHTKNREGYVDLGKICPDLVPVNAAFNVKYSPEVQSPEPLQNEDQTQTETELTARPLKSSRWSKYEENEVLSTGNNVTARELLLKSSRGGYKDTILKTDLALERNFSLEIKKIPSALSRSNTDFINNYQISPEEAEKICETYKEKKILKFNMLNSSGNVKKAEEALFETQIEPLLFAGSLYKVIKLKKADATQTQITPRTVSPQRRVMSKFFSNYVDTSNSKAPGDTTPIGAKGDMDDILDEYDDQDENVEENQSPEESSSEDEEDKKKQLINLNLKVVKTNTAKSKTHSVVDSTRSVRDSASHFSDFIRKPKLSYHTRVAILMVYLSVLVVLISVCVDVVFTKQSLKEIQDATGLIYYTNTRFFRLIAAWRAALIVYSRSVAVRPNNAALVTQYRGIVKNATLDMLKNNNMLQVLVNNFGSEIITRKFFTKKVSLWVPYGNRTAYNEKVDSFTASQVISVNNMFLANWNASIFDLKNRPEVLFALNNTANDYLVAVSESIADVEQFFEDTQQDNANLLKIIIILENFALVIPFISLRMLFKIVANAHRDLFKVVSKIPQQSIEERLRNLSKFEDYLKEDVEDRLLLYQDHKSRHTKFDKKKSEISYNRTYKLSRLIWNMIKYMMLTFIFIAVIFALFWVSYITSMEAFSDLHRINTQLVTTFEYGSQLSSILPYLYYFMIFFNQTEFKIRNDLPSNQLRISIDYLSKASEQMISVYTLPGQGIEDQEIENLLKNNLCAYIPPGDDLKVCKDLTNLNSIGLLGINAKYIENCALLILNFLDNPDLASGIKLMANINKIFGDVHVLVYDGYGALANITFSNFKEAVTEKNSNNIGIFCYTLVAIVISMVLTRLVVIRKYEDLELAVFKILKLIPYEIVEKNKVFNFYLSKKFVNEFSGVKM